MQKQYLMPTYKRKPVCFTEGKGIWLKDKDGQYYMDLVSGVAVNCLGHSSPIIVQALQEQAQKLTHISNLYWSEPQMELANMLITLSAGTMKDVFFCNSGTEALEGALKLAKKFGKQKGKNSVLFMENSFHGRTMGALSITGQPKYQEPFGAQSPSCLSVPLNDLAALGALLSEKGQDIAAVFVEPIQGEGGIIAMEAEFLEAIQAFCQSHEALLVFDEVQCGAGRTGTYYAFQSTTVVPDIVCMAKGLGGGFPIGAILAGEKASIFESGDHGSTYGGNPLACAVALAVTKTVSDSCFLKEVGEKGVYLKNKLNGLLGGKLKTVRGEGLLLGMVVESPESVVEKAFDDHLLLIAAGKDTVRLLPPLNITYEEIDQLIKKLEPILCQ